jgi:GNAT superfamily N-acetyltransferase
MERTRTKPGTLPPTGSAGFEVSCLSAPLAPDLAWEAEALLLEIFEHGDYSLRAALSGTYSQQLDCIFSFARENQALVGAAGALCGARNPSIALLGPVGVLEKYRGRGLGTALVTALVDDLRGRGCEVVYLGVSARNPAGRLYERLGFVSYQGIVRRLLLHPEGDWEQTCLAPCEHVEIRRADWGDFPSVQALLCYPGSMVTVDWSRGIFSSRYVPPARFLPLFPEIVKTCTQQGGLVNVLVTRRTQRITGFAYACRLPGPARGHIAQLEFYVHDHFLAQASHLVLATLLDAGSLGFPWLRCALLGSDRLKRRIVESLDGTPLATLPGSACINDQLEEVVVYEWNMSEVSCKTDMGL